MATLDDATEDDGPISSINIIPFVDIVLVLLVIFMLTSATIIRASLKVELPKAASAGSRVSVSASIDLSVSSPEAALGSSTLIVGLFTIDGTVIMKTIRSTSVMSTSGVTLMSAIVPPPESSSS